MHGIVMNQFRRYVLDRLGWNAWAQLIEATDVPFSTEPLPLGKIYPDAHLIALVMAAHQQTGQPVPVLLEDFGRFITPALLRIYDVLLRPEWRTLDIIEHTEEVIHTVVRQRNPGADPPALEAKRLGPDRVGLRYTSARKLCALAIGIAHGLADHFGEQVEVTQTACMHEGDDHCYLRIERVAAG